MEDDETYFDEDCDDHETDGEEGLIETTGVKMEYEEGLNHLLNYPLRKKLSPSYSYAFMFKEEDGSYNVVERNSMPCWGALREYERGTRPNDPWPEDLRTNYHIFPPTGNPMAVAACFSRMCAEQVTLNYQKSYYPTIKQWNAFIDFIFDKNISPWRKALNDVALLKNDDEMYWGCVFKDTNIDPNVMVGLLRNNVLNPQLAKNWANMMEQNPGIDPRVAYLKVNTADYYNMAGRIIPDAWFNGNVVNISSGEGFYNRESYNRPDISYLFGGKNNVGENFTNMTIDQITALIP